jgi:hypothetical protein
MYLILVTLVYLKLMAMLYSSCADWRRYDFFGYKTHEALFFVNIFVKFVFN